MGACVLACLRACLLVCVLACLRAWMYTCMCACMHACLCVRAQGMGGWWAGRWYACLILMTLCMVDYWALTD